MNDLVIKEVNLFGDIVIAAQDRDGIVAVKCNNLVVNFIKIVIDVKEQNRPK